MKNRFSQYRALIKGRLSFAKGSLTLALSLLLGTALVASAQEKWSYSGCDAKDVDVTINNFKKVVLIDRSKPMMEPVRLAIAKDGRVFIAERRGTLKVWKPGTGGSATGSSVVVSAKFDVWTDNTREMGLHGILLDPDFETNHQIYVHWAPKTPDIWKVSRFTINGDILDLASEKVILEVPVQRLVCCHTGGGMSMDFKGDLWISMGNNTKNPVASAANGYVNDSAADADDQAHAANTNDLRGKIIRIHPLTEALNGKMYTIPNGNLFPAGTDSTRPEIYTMGHRNAYTMNYDKYNGWLTWGDIGPDDNLQTEEWNLVTKPGNMGWPYFVGNTSTAKYAYRLNKDPAAPANNSKWNTGKKILPPAQPAIIAMPENAAITGPIYHYDGALNSNIKLPPHFDGKWLISDWNVGNINVVTLSTAGDKITDNRALISSTRANPTLKGVIHMEIGPDGALYVLEYGTTYFASDEGTILSRYEYTGGCHPALPILTTPINHERRMATKALATLYFGGHEEITIPDGEKGIRLFDTQGRVIWQYRKVGEGMQKISLPSTLTRGLYHMKYMD
jgi:cytochrome c